LTNRLFSALLLTWNATSDQLYFDRAHAFAPFLQKARYLSWSKQNDKPKQKVCLQYAMWALTASLSSQFHMIRHELYTEARRLLDSLELESQEAFVKRVEQSQAWLLLTIYELMDNQFQRALISAGRAFRLIQLIGLYEVDKLSRTDIQGTWVDKESMRRTFWVAYIIDRLTSMVNGLPLTLDEPGVRGPHLSVYDSHSLPSFYCSWEFCCPPPTLTS
jgi:hypothetical protein